MPSGLGNSLGVIASVIAIGGGAYWVYDVNVRLDHLELKANLGIGAALEAQTSVADGTQHGEKKTKSNETEVDSQLNSLSVGQSTLEKLCDDVGSKLASALSDPDSTVSVRFDLQKYFDSLRCGELLTQQSNK